MVLDIIHYLIVLIARVTDSLSHHLSYHQVLSTIPSVRTDLMKLSSY